jgi:ABC-type Zn uptake system ZnuABC Zn-binding protein ZnuA
MRKLSVLFLLSLLVVACDNTGKPKKPKNLISEDKMEAVLYDLYIINAAKGVNRKLLETNGFFPETYVLTKHKIDSVQFADSNAYYAFDTDSYKTIVENVKERLEKDKKSFEELQKIEGREAKRKRDSLDKIKQRKIDSINKSVKEDAKN